jgi:hypothetical protein
MASPTRPPVSGLISLPDPFGRALDGTQYPGVRSAAADIVVQRLRDLRPRRRRISVEQRLGGAQITG